MQLPFGGFTLPPLPLARHMTPTRAPFRFFFSGLFSGRFSDPRFSAPRAIFGIFRAGMSKSGGPKRAETAKKASARDAFFFFRRLKVPETPKRPKSSFYYSKTMLFGPPSDPKTTPRGPPESRNRAPGTALNRPGPIPEFRTRRRFARERPNAPGEQKSQKRGPKSTPKNSVEMAPGAIKNDTASPVLFFGARGLSGVVFGSIWGRFGVDLGPELGRICDWFRRARSHALCIKSAMHRSPQPQLLLPWGGGLAKRPQFEGVRVSEPRMIHPAT